MHDESEGASTDGGVERDGGVSPVGGMLRETTPRRYTQLS